MTQANSVLEPIEKSWGELSSLVDSLGPHGLTITGADGWAVKDHLVHVAAWEHSLIALLSGADIHNAMGVGPDVDKIDSINAAVWALHHEKTPEQALEYFHQTHAVLVKLLGTMSDEDLKLPYNHFQPQEPRSDASGDRPALDWVASDTYEHYAEHVGWLDQLVRDSSAAR